MGRSLQNLGLRLYAWWFAIRGAVHWRPSSKNSNLDHP